MKAEGAKIRARKVWDDSSVIEREVLCSQADDKKGETIHVAHTMTITGVKNSKLPASQHIHKGRVVYGGDAVKDQDGLPAMFRELHSLPTNIQAVNLTLFLGLVEGFVIQTADACAAFLQAPLSSTTPTWVTLARELWLPSWEGRFRRSTVCLSKASYGHPEAPAEWHSFFGGVICKHLNAELVDGFASAYWLPPNARGSNHLCRRHSCGRTPKGF